MNELRNLVRQIAKELDVEGVGPGSAPVIIAPLKNLVAPNIHVGKTNLNEEETVEWFAGQLLNIVDNQFWFAVNSWLNYVDKFCPEKKEQS